MTTKSYHVGILRGEPDPTIGIIQHRECLDCLSPDLVCYVGVTYSEADWYLPQLDRPDFLASVNAVAKLPVKFTRLVLDSDDIDGYVAGGWTANPGGYC